MSHRYQTSLRRHNARRHAIHGQRGLTLVELSIAVSLAGVVLAVFLPSFLREFHASKSSEAALNLASLHRHAASYFDAPHRTDGQIKTGCLPKEAGPTPYTLADRARTVDFFHKEARGRPTWKALNFNPEEPLRYRYRFMPEEARCGLREAKDGPLLRLRAEGDLNGDGILSLFERVAGVNSQGEFVPIGILHITDPVE